ncbi:MAG: ParA family protein [Candidatus Krumholzibacteriota bacterium]|nr:ParA family protein [Candidatus Krumholzibacteriota bacterium]
MHKSEAAAFLNHKGGVGKTTSVANVGAGLSILGKKVLLVDLDPQGHLTGFLGIEPGEISKTIYDVMRGDAAPGEAIIERPLRARLCIDGCESRLSMALIPSKLDLADAEMTFTQRIDREFLLREAIARVSGDFDYILFDCPPSLGLISINALAASRKVFIPVQTEHLALKSLENLIKIIESIMAGLNEELTIGGLIATRFDGRKVLNRTVLKTLKDSYGPLLLDTVIRENIVLAESPRWGKDIFSYRPKSYGMEDYMNLSLEIMGRIAAANTLFSVERGVIKSNTSGAAAW